jgi:hypothetical protein
MSEWKDEVFDEGTYKITHAGKMAFMTYLFTGEMDEELTGLDVDIAPFTFFCAIFSSQILENMVDNERFEIAEVWQKITDIFVEQSKRLGGLDEE